MIILYEVFCTIILLERLTLCWRFILWLIPFLLLFFFYMYFFFISVPYHFVIFGLVCPENENATPQPQRYKPPNTTTEEFLNRQAEALSIDVVAVFVCLA